MFKKSTAEPVIGWDALIKLFTEVFQIAAWPPYLSEDSYVQEAAETVSRTEEER